VAAASADGEVEDIDGLLIVGTALLLLFLRRVVVDVVVVMGVKECMMEGRVEATIDIASENHFIFCVLLCFSFE